MRISFIVVALNAGGSLRALLDDLRAQTLPPEQLEVLLVDSGSTDDTLAVMEAFAKSAPCGVRVLHNPKRWLASGINIALDAATGDAVIRLDAHARIPADFLERNVEAMEAGESIVEAATRELREETGALEFALHEICPYSVEDGGAESFGMLFFAEIYRLEPELHHEIQEIWRTRTLPENWTYPEVQPVLLAEAKRRGLI